MVLPPMTVRGALVLGGGVLRPGELGLARGRIVSCEGAAEKAAVDLSGYAVLPGAVDVGGVAGAGAEAVRAAAGAAAQAGTTSFWVGVDWPDRTDDLDAVRARLAGLAAARPGLPVDLGLRLRVGTHGIETAEALLAALPGLPSPVVVFRHPPEAERAEMEAALGGAGPVARHLCRLASAFDALRLRYATEADPDAEHRERFSMIGARMAMRPVARGAAASARAMGEPVVLAASDILGEDGARIGRGTGAVLLAEGLCDAVASFGAPDAPRRLVRLMVEGGLMPLGHAWALVSSAPAGLVRRADRGGLVEGTRADLAVVDPDTLEVAATIAGGVLVHATPEALERFRPVLGRPGLAAE